MTPLELKNYCPFLIREKFGIVYQKLIFELNGQSRLLLEDSKPKKNIVSSRSFSHAISDLPTLSQAICYFVSIAAAKARAQHSKATGLSLYIRTDRFNHEIEQYSQGVEINLEIPTNDTIHLNRAAKKLLKQIYRPGYNYKKAEVCLKGLIDEKFEQYVLFEEGIHSPHEKLMELMDSVNYKMGKQTLFFAAEGIKKNWITRSRGRSKRYTTRWDELKEVS